MSISFSTDSLKEKLLFEMKKLISNEVEQIEEDSIVFEELCQMLPKKNIEILKSVLKESKIIEIKKLTSSENLEFKIFVENLSDSNMKKLKNLSEINEMIDIFNQMKILIIKTKKGE